MFARGSDNGLWHWWENSPGGPWAAEMTLAGTWAGAPAVALDSRQRLDVFARSTAGSIQHNWQTFNVGSGWSGWNTLGGNFVADPVVARTSDGLLQVFARAGDGTTSYRAQTGTGTWSNWTSLGSPRDGNGGGNGSTDTTPDAFTFTAVTGQALNTDITSNTITVTGINAPASINVQGGTLIINGQVSQASTLTQGNTVAVKVRSAGSGNASTTATVSIGGVSGTFKVTTGSSDTPSTAAQAVKFAPNNVYQRDIKNAPIDPNSANMMGELISQQIAPNYSGNVAVNAYEFSASFFVADASTPRQTVAFDDCQGKGYTPDGLFNGPGMFLNVPIPANAIEALGSDKNLTIYDPVQDKLWEFWVASKTASGTWRACWGGRIDNVSRDIGDFQCPYGGPASGLSFAGSMITLDEARRGQINHAMYMALIAPAPWNNMSWPANRSDGFNTSVNAIPEGSLLRLDPNLNVDTLNLTPFAKMVARAAQKYGFIVADKAGAVNISLQSGRAQQLATGVDPWAAIFGATPNYAQLQNFPWDKVQVIQKDYGKPAGYDCRNP